MAGQWSGWRKPGDLLLRQTAAGEHGVPRILGAARRRGAGLVLAMVLLAWIGYGRTTPVQAQTPPAAAAPAPLVNQADLFLHYSLLGDQRLAHDYGQAILRTKPEPVTLLHAFEQAANGRHIFQILIDNQRNQTLRAVSAAIEHLLVRGHLAVARNPWRIKAAILAMDHSPRAFVVARQRLTAAGEFAAPFFFHYLNTPGHRALAPYIIQMMSNIGKPLLNPLVCELSTPVVTEKIQIVNVLGNIGYKQALPYLLQIVQSSASGPDLKAAARLAIAKIDPRGRLSRRSAAALYMWLAWGYFDQAPGLTVNHPGEATNPVWYYDPKVQNVAGAMVPTPIWKDLEAMRACEASLRLDPNNGQAISLWLAADLRREVDLPEGATDPTHPATAPPAHYYALAAGPAYLNPALSIALHTHNNRLILKVIRALEQTGGVHGLIGDGRAPTPLIQAMSCPDPQVRLQAAFALAAANPRHSFTGAYEVVPLLADALAQTGKPTVVLVDPNPQRRNHLAGGLSPRYHIVATASLAPALARSRHVPYLAFLLITGRRAVGQMERMPMLAPRFTYTPTLLLAPPAAVGALRLRYVSEKTFAVLPVGAPVSLIEQTYQRILRRVKAMPPSGRQSLQDALEAAHLLKLIALNRASIYRADAALPALGQVLRSGNRKLAWAAADVLGRMQSPQAQQLLAAAALSGTGSAATRAHWFTDLAWSARNMGDHLNHVQIRRLIHVVAHGSVPTVRIAAAEALGALNLPSNQASVLIRAQIR